MANHVRVSKSLEDTLNVLISERDRLDENISTLQKMIEEQGSTVKKRGEGGEVTAPTKADGRKTKWTAERKATHSAAMKKRWEGKKSKKTKNKE